MHVPICLQHSLYMQTFSYSLCNTAVIQLQQQVCEIPGKISHNWVSTTSTWLYNKCIVKVVKNMYRNLWNSSLLIHARSEDITWLTSTAFLSREHDETFLSQNLHESINFKIRCMPFNCVLTVRLVPSFCQQGSAVLEQL